MWHVSAILILRRWCWGILLDYCHLLCFEQLLILHSCYAELCDNLCNNQNFVTIRTFENVTDKSCCFWSVGVGLLVQPFYVALMVMTLQQQQATCITYSFFVVVVYIFSGASFLSIICESVDGFLAIRLNLRYQELVTSKRVTVAVILVWLLCSTWSIDVRYTSTENCSHYIRFTRVSLHPT